MLTTQGSVPIGGSAQQALPLQLCMRNPCKAANLANLYLVNLTPSCTCAFGVPRPSRHPRSSPKVNTVA